MRHCLSRVFVLLTCCLFAASAAAQSNAPRIMPLGDSITQGAAAPGGYRAPLYDRFVAAGVTPNFVGAQSGVFGDPDTLPDHEHDGYGGYRIDQIAEGMGLFGAPDVPIEVRLDAWDPTVVLLHAGTNDLVQDYYLDGDKVLGIPSVIERLEALVARITTHSPEVYVVVAQIIPSTFESVNERIEAFNAQIPGLVARQQALGYRVGTVDMYAPLTPFEAGDFSGVHPTAEGYRTMADVWLWALRAIGPVPNLNPGRDDGVLQLDAVSTTSTRPWPPSATDLINVGTTTLERAVHQGYDGLPNSVEALHDGQAEGGTFDADNTWRSTFVLNTEVNIAGYDLTEIRTGAGGPFGIFQQAYEVWWSSVDAPTVWNRLGGFHHIPLNLTSQQASGLVLRKEEGPLASGVKAVQFRFVEPPVGGQTGYYEIEVLGAPAGQTQAQARSVAPRLTLGPAFPNPTRRTAELSFYLPEALPVRVDVFDMTGRQVAVLLDEQRGAGGHTVQFDAGHLPNGVYSVRLETPLGVQARRVTLLK